MTDPNPHSLFGQAFLELQFYPDSIVNTCSSDGGFNVRPAPDKFSVCSPVWQVSTTSGAENAAFNAELYDGSSNAPLVMNAGDTIKIHFFVGRTGQGWNIHVTDVTTGHSGSIVLNSKYGPLLPLFSSQQVGNALGWGLVNDTPNSFVWEIWHTSDFASPAGKFCGTAEVTSSCASYGGRYCTYPWYAANSIANAITYSADYPGTKFDYQKGSQFATAPLCSGPFGPDTTFCDTGLSPAPPLK